jgi:hypothetical protein
MKSNYDKPSEAVELKLDHLFHCRVDCESLDRSGRAHDHTIGLRLQKTACLRRTRQATHKEIKFILAQSIRLFVIRAAIEKLNRHNFPKNESLDYFGMKGYCCLEVSGCCFCGINGHDLRKMEDGGLSRALNRAISALLQGRLGNLCISLCFERARLYRLRKNSAL